MTPDTPTQNSPGDEHSKQWQKHGVWMGLVIAVSNLFIYLGYFVPNSPAQRDVPWFNLPFSWVGLFLAVIGTCYVYKHSHRLLIKVLATSGFLLTLLFVGLFNWFIFSYSYSLPESPTATAMEEVAPVFSLLDQNGEKKSLSSYRGKNVVLVFYRGHW